MRTWYGVIIDDQQASIDHLLSLLEDVGYIDIVATFVQEREAQRYLHANAVDFIILDVELSNSNAFTFLAGLANPKIPTILYTAFEQYEDRGYDMALVDVLLKPVSQSRLWGALRRVNDELKKSVPLLEDELEMGYHFFQVKGPLRYERTMVWYRNIVYVDTANGKVQFHMVGGDMLESNSTFKAVLEKLPNKWFKQCIHNIVFNINFYQGYVGGRVVLTELKTPNKLTLTPVKKEPEYVALPVGARTIYTDFYNFLDSNVI